MLEIEIDQLRKEHQEIVLRLLEESKEDEKHMNRLYEVFWESDILQAEEWLTLRGLDLGNLEKLHEALLLLGAPPHPKQVLPEGKARLDYDYLSNINCCVRKGDRLRVLSLLDKHANLEKVTFWQLFKDIWTDSESLFKDIDLIESLLQPQRCIEPERLVALTDDELRLLETLPDEVEIFRGCTDINQNGWCYTLDRDKAVWFAERFPIDNQPLLISAIVPKRNIILYLEDRAESEVIVNPKDLSSLTITRLPALEIDDSAPGFLFTQTQTGNHQALEDFVLQIVNEANNSSTKEE